MCAFVSYEPHSISDAFEGSSFATVLPKALLSSVDWAREPHV